MLILSKEHFRIKQSQADNRRCFTQMSKTIVRNVNSGIRRMRDLATCSVVPYSSCNRLPAISVSWNIDNKFWKKQGCLKVKGQKVSNGEYHLSTEAWLNEEEIMNHTQKLNSVDDVNLSAGYNKASKDLISKGFEVEYTRQFLKFKDSALEGYSFSDGSFGTTPMDTALMSIWIATHSEDDYSESISGSSQCLAIIKIMRESLRSITYYMLYRQRLPVELSKKPKVDILFEKAYFHLCRFLLGFKIITQSYTARIQEYVKLLRNHILNKNYYLSLATKENDKKTIMASIETRRRMLDGWNRVVNKYDAMSSRVLEPEYQHTALLLKDLEEVHSEYYRNKAYTELTICLYCCVYHGSYHESSKIDENISKYFINHNSPQNEIWAMQLLNSTDTISSWRLSSTFEKAIKPFIQYTRLHLSPFQPKQLPVSIGQCIFIKSRNPAQASADSSMPSFCVAGYRVEQCAPGAFRFTCADNDQLAAVVSVGQCSRADVCHIDEALGLLFVSVTLPHIVDIFLLAVGIDEQGRFACRQHAIAELVMPATFAVSVHRHRVAVLSTSASSSFQAQLLTFDDGYLAEPVCQTVELTGLAQSVEAAKKQLKTGPLVLTGGALGAESVVVQLTPKKVKDKVPTAMLFCSRLAQPQQKAALDCISGQRQGGLRVQLVRVGKRVGWLAVRQAASLRYRLSLASADGFSVLHDFGSDPGLAQILRRLNGSRGSLPLVEGWNDATESWDMWCEKRRKDGEKVILHASLRIKL